MVDSRMEAHVRARRIGGLSGYRITKPHRSEAYQEPCGNCAEAGIFAFFLNGRFERIPKPRSTAYPPDCHTILCALLHRCARTHGPNLAFDVEDLSAPQAHPRRDTAGAWRARRRACVHRRGARVQRAVCADVLTSLGRAGGVYAGGTMGEGSSRETGGDGARSVVRAAPSRALVRGVQRLADGAVHWRGEAVSSPDDEGQDGVGGVRGGAGIPDGVSRSVRRVPCARRMGVSQTLLVRFDNNHYSVQARAVGARSRYARMPSGLFCARMGRRWVSILAASGAAKSPTTTGINGSNPTSACAVKGASF